jgi:hypothetical protein
MSNKMFTRLRRDTATSVPPNCLHPIVDDRPVEDLGSYSEPQASVHPMAELLHFYRRHALGWFPCTERGFYRTLRLCPG